MSSPPPRTAYAGSGSGSALLGAGAEFGSEASSLTVSEEVAAGIESLGRLSASDLSTVLEATLTALTTPSTEACTNAVRIVGGDGRISDAATAKAGANAIATVFLEAARLAAPEDAVRCCVLFLTQVLQ